MQKIRRRKIGEILLSEGLVNHDHIQAALERQKTTGEPVGEALMSDGVVTENDIVRAICIQYQLPFIRPRAYQINTQLYSRFAVEFLFQNRIVPLDEIGSSFIVAVGEVPSEAVEAQIKGRLSDQVFFYFAPVSEVEAVLVQHYGLNPEQVVTMNTARLKRNRGEDPTAGGGAAGAAAAAAAAEHGNLLDTLDSSWEAIFDEAEGNLS